MFSIVIPVYNESESLPILLRELQALECISENEIVIVDDSLDDHTIQACKPFFRVLNINYIHRKRRLGLASAVVEGFAVAKGEILICMDGDGSHSPEIVQSFINEFSKVKEDLIIGSRYVKGGKLGSEWSFIRRIVSKSFCIFVLPLTSVKDPMSGCFAIRKEFYSSQTQPLNPIGYKILLEILVKFQMQKVHEIPLSFRLRNKGSSKITLKIMLDSIIHLLKLYYFRLS